MIPNRIRQHWAAGRPVINGWLGIANGFTAEIMAAQGYDSLTVDIQHGIVDYQNAVAMFQAMRASGTVPLARVPWLEPGAIMKVLDSGAYGVICPMVNTREQAERLVSYVRYPPKGTRSFGPTRMTLSAGADYAAHANDEVLCLAMIETAEAMDNLEDIVGVAGLDGVYVGPADLTLGVTNGRLAPGFDREEPEMIDAIRRILAAAHGAGIRAALHTGTPDYAARALEWGYDMVTISSDARLLAAAARADLERVRALSERFPSDDAAGDVGY